jgi:hypothetical protein
VFYSGDFTFQFPARMTAASVTSWPDNIGDRRTLVKQIGVVVEGRASSSTYHRTQTFRVLRRELENLKSADIRVVFFKHAAGSGCRREEKYT